MARYDYPDVSTAAVRPMSEARLAERLARNGATIRYAHGRYWRRMKRGFYAPLHWLARMDPQEARRPRGSWGFVAGLHARHAASANAAIPVHVLTNLADFRTADIPKDTRRAYRRIEERGIRIVHVTDDEVFRDQGYGVLQDWRGRKGLRPVPREEFMADCEEWVEDEAWVVAAAMQEDELLGYASAWAVEHASFLRTYAFLKRTLHAGLRLSSVLNFALVSVLQRTGSIKEVSPGIAEPEYPSVMAHKIEQGFPIVEIPARLALPWPVARYLRWASPNAYYRLTGSRAGA